jgi:hypothetical protein
MGRLPREGKLVNYQSPSIFTYIIFFALMWIPALAGLVARRTAPDREPDWAPLWPVPVARAVYIAFLIPLIFGLIYGLTSLFGTASPQWGLGTLVNGVNDFMTDPLTPQQENLMVPIAYGVGIPVTIVLGVTLYALVFLGGELGWRGYLLPRLLPLGRFRANVLVSLLWGLWFLPLILGWHYQYDQWSRATANISCYMGIALTLGMITGQVALRTHHIGLSAILVGAFLGQIQGMWTYLFPSTRLPWSGSFSIIAIAVWAVVALMPFLVTGRNKKADLGLSVSSLPDDESGNEDDQDT